MSDSIIFTTNETKSGLSTTVGTHVMKVSGELGSGILTITDSDGVPVYEFSTIEQRGVFVSTTNISATLTGATSPNCQLHIYNRFC